METQNNIWFYIYMCQTKCIFEKAQSYLPGLEIKKASAEKIPFEDNSFDLVFMGLVFHEVDDYTKALKEAYREAGKEVSLLEWDYVEAEFGPPLTHRLQSTFIETLSNTVGFNKVEVIKLKSLVLYKLIK